MCLLVGPRGHGKRTLLKSCLRKLHQDHPKEKFRSIKISGLMMMNNSSDLSAVREIAAQLTVDYDVTNTYDNSNTFRPVIATDFYDDSALEYFDESDGSESWDEEIFNGKIDSTKNIDRVVDVFVSPRAKVPSSAKKRRLGNSRVSQGIDKKENLNEVLDRELPNNRHQKSFQSNLSVLTDAMKRAKVDRTPLLIILEDMEVFADRTSFRQVLLYHLLDKVGAPDTLIVVVGITSRLTISQMFEKRVRSRSGSQVMIHFPRYSYDDLKNILLKKLNTNGGIESTKHFTDLLSDDGFIHKAFLRSLSLGRNIRWYTGVLTMALSISEFFTKESFQQEIIESMIACGADMSHLSDDLKTDPTKLIGDQRLQALYQLSGIQLAILLTAKRLMSRDAQDDNDRSETITLTFNKIHREYESYTKTQSSGIDFYGKPLFFRAFLQLLETEVMKLIAEHSGVGPLQHNYNTFTANHWNMETLQHAPVYLCIDLQTELHTALYERRLDCSTAFRDWALKIN